MLHATGMVSSVFVDYCVLFLALMIPEFVQIFFWGGQDKKHFGRSSSTSSTRLRTLTKSYKIQVSGSALGKTIKNNACPVVIFGYTLISVDPACRIPGDLRPATAPGGHGLIQNWAGQRLHRLTCCGPFVSHFNHQIERPAHVICPKLFRDDCRICSFLVTLQYFAAFHYVGMS